MAKLKHETTIVDRNTGEIITSSKSFSVKSKSSEEFYMTFIQFVQPLLRFKSIRDMQVLTKFCMMIEYNTNRVILPAPRRKQICEELGMENTHLSNCIRRLKDLRIITGDKGVYEVNPIYFWKGTTDSRDKLLKNEGLEIRIKFTGNDKDFK